MNKFKLGDAIQYGGLWNSKCIYYIYSFRGNMPEIYPTTEIVFLLGNIWPLGDSQWEYKLSGSPSFGEVFDESGFSKSLKQQFAPYWGSLVNVNKVDGYSL